MRAGQLRLGFMGLVMFLVEFRQQVERTPLGARADSIGRGQIEQWRADASEQRSPGIAAGM